MSNAANAVSGSNASLDVRINSPAPKKQDEKTEVTTNVVMNALLKN